MKVLFSALTVLSIMLASVSLNMAAAAPYLLSEETYNALNEAQQLMEKQQYSAAEKQLATLLAQVETKRYDAAMMQQTLGYLYSSQQSYAKAADAFQKALAAQALPDDVSHNLRYNLGQILIADRQFKSGIEQLEIWLKQEKTPDNAVYVLLATAHYQRQNFTQAASYISTAIKNSKKPQQDWYQLLLSSYLSLKQFKSAISVLETLIVRDPRNKTYWQQLASLYLQENAEFRALAVRVLTQKLALGDGDTLTNLAEMYRYLGIPYKSAQLLQQGITDGVIADSAENLQQLADSLIAAHEDKQAAAILQQMLMQDDSGQAHLNLGQIYIAQEQWQQAVEVLTSGLTQLTGADVGQAHTLLGMAYFNLGLIDQANQQFTKALAFEQQRAQANQWLQHLEQLQEQHSDPAS